MSSLLTTAALLLGSALGGEEPGIALPSGASAAIWRQPLALAGLSLATGDVQAAVVVRLDGGAWVLEVVGVDGVVRSLRLSPPADEAAREDLAVLAASLIEEVRLELPPPPQEIPLPPPVVVPVIEVPEPAPEPVVIEAAPEPPASPRSRPRPLARPLRVPTVDVNPQVLDFEALLRPVAVAPAVSGLSEVVFEPAIPSPPRPWLHLAAAASIRPETSANPGFALGTGVLFDSGLELGVQLVWSRHDLEALEGERSFEDRCLVGLVGLVPGRAWLRPAVRGSLGPTWRGFRGQQGFVESRILASAGVEAGVRVGLGPLEAQLGPRLSHDLVDTRLEVESVDGAQASELSPWEVQLLVSVGTTARRRP